MIDKKLILNQYKEWVDTVSDDLEEKTHFTIEEIVDKVVELVLLQVSNEEQNVNDANRNLTGKDKELNH